MKDARPVQLSIVVGLTVLASTCTDPYKAPPLPTPPTVTSTAVAIVLTATPGTGATLGQFFLSITVNDSQGHGVPSIAVALTTTAGALSPNTATTDAGGLAQAKLEATRAARVTARAGDLTATLDVDSEIPLTVTLSMAPPSPEEDQAVTFTATQTGAAPARFSWAFGTGATAETTTGSTTYAYPSDGTYQVHVAVVDPNGRRGSASGAIRVAPRPTATTTTTTIPPTLGVVLSCTPKPPLMPTLCNATVSYKGATLPSASITDVHWEWGDSNTGPDGSSLINSHAYAQEGTYTLATTVIATTSDDIMIATATKVITIPEK